MHPAIIVARGSDRFVKAVWGRAHVFVLVLGTTDTSLIPGITVAGASPELTHYTPPADAEYLILGRCKILKGVPVTPEGIPTPALITRAAVGLSKAPVIVANAGLKHKPLIPFVDLGGVHGRDIRTGKAIPREVVNEVYDRAVVLGRELSKAFDLVVVGESIPAGTTTAMAVLIAMGYDAWGKVSSASPHNPHELKRRVVQEALRAAGVEGERVDDGLEAVSLVGDPVIPAVAGVAVGACSGGSWTLLAGGTQMAAVLSVIRSLKPEVLERVAVGTTRWILADRTSDILGLVESVDPRVPVLAANLSFADAPYPGLRRYEEGYVKEGVGAGGSCIAAIASSGGSVSAGSLLDAIVLEYSKIADIRPSERFEEDSGRKRVAYHS